MPRRKLGCAAAPGRADVVETVAAPIQCGRLFITPDLVYGHLRDFRDEPGAATLEAGSLCVVASRTLLVTGRRIPLLSVKELLCRVEAHTVRPASPCGLITEFFRALNDIGERLLQQASERLSAMESKVLKRDGAGQRKDILEMRRDSIRVARDMAYKRTAMLEFTRERPALFPAEEFDRFDRQIHRYAALSEDTQDYAEHCQFLVEELRAQVEEETNRNLYILTMFSVIFLPATLIAGIWGMNVGGIPFSGSSERFLGGRRGDNGSLHLVRDRPLPAQVQVLLKPVPSALMPILLSASMDLPFRRSIDRSAFSLRCDANHAAPGPYNHR